MAKCNLQSLFWLFVGVSVVCGIAAFVLMFFMIFTVIDQRNLVETDCLQQSSSELIIDIPSGYNVSGQTTTITADNSLGTVGSNKFDCWLNPCHWQTSFTKNGTEVQCGSFYGISISRSAYLVPNPANPYIISFSILAVPGLPVLAVLVYGCISAMADD